jgi:signal transduction histidine kinase
MRSTIVVLFFFLLTFQVAKAHRSLDSLKHILYSPTDKNQQINTLFELCDNSRMLPIDTFEKYTAQATTLCTSSDSNQNLIAAYYRLVYFYKRGELDSFLQVYNANYKKTSSNPQLRIHYNLFYGYYLIKKNQYKDAINQHLEVLKIAEQTNDSLYIVASKNGIGWAYMELFQLDDAITWFKKSLNTTQNTYYLRNASSVYNNLASCYGTMGKFDSAAYYNEKAIESGELNNDIVALANAYFIKGNICIVKNKFTDAEQFFLKGYDIHKQYGDPFFIVSDMANIAIHYANMNNTTKGIQLANDAIDYANNNNLSGKLFIAYEALSINYEKSGQYKLYAETLKKMSAIKDSTYQLNSEKAIAEMNAKYENEKKESIIHLQKLELNRKNIILTGGILFIILSFFLTFTAYRNYKHKQDNRLQLEIMKQQDLSTQAVIEAEENERQRIAADLHDGIGQLLTAARLNIEALKNRLTQNTVEDKVICDKALSLVEEGCKEIRNVSHNIMPNSLLKMGIGKALKDFIDKIESNDLTIHLNVNGINEIKNSNTELFVYRVIQESINNVIKHSKASQLDISIINDQDGLRVSIEDNGIGFDKSTIDSKNGLGMKNIKARIDFLKGTLDIDSMPGKGTLVAFYIPYTN